MMRVARVEKYTCSHDCPFWGKPGNHIYSVRCDCGREFYACGYCLQEGRLRACAECSAKPGSQEATP